MYKIAVLGDRDSICGFACVGIETCCVSDERHAETEFMRMRKDNYAVIFITEYYGEKLKEMIKETENSPLPAVILIPGAFGNTGEGMNRISDFVEKAVGSVIL